MFQNFPKHKKASLKVIVQGVNNFKNKGKKMRK